MPDFDLNAIKEKLKALYFKYEDKYYNFLDKIDPKTRIYKIVDPIDKIFPSFALILIILALFILAGFFLALSSLMAPSTTDFLVLDQDGDPIDGVIVEFTFENGDTLTARSDDFGEFSIGLPANSALVEVLEDGYEEYSEEMVFQGGSVNEIMLEESVPEVEEKIIEVRDERGALSGATLRFTCSQNATPPDTIRGADSTSVVSVGSNCGTLSVVVTLTGYEQVTKALTGKTTIINMRADEETPKGTLSVKVVDAVTGSGVSGIELTVFRNSTKVAQGQTDYAGEKDFDLEAGDYIVKARDTDVPPVYKNSETGTIELDIDDEKEVEIKLEKTSSADSGQISVIFEDKSTGDPISGVEATFYEDGLFSSISVSGADGTVAYYNADSSSVYSLVAAHAEYVLKTVESLPIVGIDGGEKLTVALQKAEAPAKFGSVLVKVKSYEGNPIEDASVELYAEDFSHVLLTSVTNEDGEAEFTNLPYANYKAVAQSSGQSGESDYAELASNSQLVLNVSLVLEEGQIRVTVVDTSGNPVQNADVEFHSLVLGKLDGESTDSEGKTPEMSFRVDAEPYMIVSKDGYITVQTVPYKLAARGTIKPKVILRNEGDYSSLKCDSEKEFCIGLVKVSKAGDSSAISRFDDDKHYTLYFDIFAGTGIEDVLSVVRAGLEENIDAVDSAIIIEDIRASGASALKFPEYDPSDNYAELDSTSADGKVAYITLGDLEAGIYNFEVDVYVKALAEGADEEEVDIEIRYGATGKRDGEQLYLPSDPERLFLYGPFTLGEPIFCDPETGICPNFVFDAVLSDPSEQHLTGDVRLDEDELQELRLGIEYNLDVTVHNRHSSGKSFSNFTLDFVPFGGSLSVSPPSLEWDYLSNMDSANSSVVLTPNNSAGSATLQLLLDVAEKDNNISYDFSIKGPSDLEIEAVPRKLITDTAMTLQINVVDDVEGEAISGASVNWYTNEAATVLGGTFGETATRGVYLATIPARAEGESIYIKAEKSLYGTSNILKVEVGPATADFTSLWSFDCVALEDASGSQIEGDYAEATVIYNSDARAMKITNNCDESIDVALDVPSASETEPDYARAGPITLENSSGTVLRNDCKAGCSSAGINSGASLIVNARGDRLMGHYDIDVRLRYSGETTLHFFKTVGVSVVSDGSQTFTLDRAVYDLESDDIGGIITNNNYLDLGDFWKPKVNFLGDFTKYHAEQDRFADLGAMTISWELLAKGTDTSSSYLSVESPASLDCVEEENKPNGIGFTAICSETSCNSPSGSCSGAKTYSSSAVGYIDFSEMSSITLKEVWVSPGGGAAISVNGTEVYTLAEDCSSARKRVYPELGLDISDFTSNPDLNSISATATSCNGDPAFVAVKVVFENESDTIDQLLTSGTYSILTPEDKIYTIGEVPVDVFESLNIDPEFDSIRLEVTNNAPDILDTWAEGSTTSDVLIKAQFTPEEARTGPEIEFNVINDSLVGRDFGLIKVVDYASVDGSDVFEAIDFDYTIQAVGDTDPVGGSASIAADGELHEIGVLGDLYDGDYTDGVYFTASTDNEFVVLKFGDSIENVKTSTNNLEDKLYATTGYNMTKTNYVDVAILIDTSKSMDDEWQTICATKDKIIQTLQAHGFYVQFKVYGMDEKRSCSEEAIGWPSGYDTIDYSSHDDSKDESWGINGQTAIGTFPWRENSRRVLLIIGDNDPSGKGRDDDGWRNNEEEEITEELVAKANAEDVSLFFMHPADLEQTSANQHDCTRWNEADCSNSKPDVIEVMNYAAEQTNGFVHVYDESGDPGDPFGFDRFVLLILRSTHEPQIGYFHVKIEAGEESVCFGANDVRGATGPDAVPRVLASWGWNDIGIDACDQVSYETGEMNDFVYCDATQFTTEVVKRLLTYRAEVEKEGSFTNVGKLLNFNSLLIRDGYTDDFIADFGEYLESDFYDFGGLSDELKDEWSLLFKNANIRIMRAGGDNLDTLEFSGIYAVTIHLDWINSSKKNIFFVNGVPNVNVRVILTPIQEADTSMVLYMLPIDGAVGLDSERKVDREGYGIGFTGDDFASFGLYTIGSAGELTINGSTGSPLIPNVFLEKDVRFSTVNGSSKGRILNVKQESDEDYSISFTPGYPNSVIIKAMNKGTEAADVRAFLNLYDIANSALSSSSGFLANWSAVASNISTCSGTNLTANGTTSKLTEFKNIQDISVSSASGIDCDTSIPQKSYGFVWNDLPAESYVAYNGTIYTPSKGYYLRNACEDIDSDSIRITGQSYEGFANDNVIITSDFLESSVDEVYSLSDIFQLVEDEYVCVASDSSNGNAELSFWWNESKVYDDLAASKDNYVCDLDMCGIIPESCT